MTTKEAFENLCKDPARCERVGMNEGTRRGYLSYLKNHKPISLDKMEEWLNKAGYHVKIEKTWSTNAGESFLDITEILELVKNLHPWTHMVNVKTEDGPVPNHHTHTIIVKTKSPVV